MARQGAEAEADSMKAEVDAVVARQQERVADWEGAVAEEEAALAGRQQELQARASCPVRPCLAPVLPANEHLCCKHFSTDQCQ